MCFHSFAVLTLVTALQLQAKTLALNPGAGIGVTETGLKVEKDGFSAVECLTDSMLEEADKYGENRELYSNKFNVSIVRYADIVDREVARKMTQQVCFDFCRTIEDMHFFGLVHGRDCYCTPYYERATSGGGVCDLPCEGDSSQMCGGKATMNVFEMHMCANTAEDMDKAREEALHVYGVAKGAGKWGQKAADMFESAADTLKLEANNVGDMNSHDIGQQMKEHAGTVLHAAEKAEKAADELSAAMTALNHLQKLDLTKPDNVYEAEAAIKDVKKLTAQTEKVGQKSSELNMAFYPEIPHDDALAGSKLFTGVLDLVHKWQGVGKDNSTHVVDHATTCTGEFAADPLIGLTMSECAEACNVFAPSSDDNYCVGFQHFYVGDIDLWPAGTTTTEGCEDHDNYVTYYYTGCEGIWEQAMMGEEYYYYLEQWKEGREYYGWYYPACDDDYYWGCPEWPEVIEGETCGAHGVWHHGYYAENNMPQPYYWASYDNRNGNTDFGAGDHMTPAEACCKCGGGRSTVTARPNTGLCVLLKEIDHVYEYNCPVVEEEECVTSDPRDLHICAAVLYYPEFCGMDEAKNCCVCKNVLNGDLKALVAANRTHSSSNATHHKHRHGHKNNATGHHHNHTARNATKPAVVLRKTGGGVRTRPGDKKLTGVARGLSKQTHTKKMHSNNPHHIHRNDLHRKHHKKTALLQETKKKKDDVVPVATKLTTANHCMVRSSWMIAAPRKPKYEHLNTCLDTGNLVLPAEAEKK